MTETLISCSDPETLSSIPSPTETALSPLESWSVKTPLYGSTRLGLTRLEDLNYPPRSKLRDEEEVVPDSTPRQASGRKPKAIPILTGKPRRLQRLQNRPDTDTAVQEHPAKVKTVQGSGRKRGRPSAVKNCKTTSAEAPTLTSNSLPSSELCISEISDIAS